MRKLLLMLSLAIGYSPLCAQIDLNAGDILFVGFDCEGSPTTDASGNGFYFVTLVDIAADKAIYFTDNKWDGSTFISDGSLNKDGEVVWTPPAAGLPAGSMVHILNTQGGSDGQNVFCPATHGSVSTVSGAGKLVLQQGGDALYAYRLDSNNEEVFLTAITNEAFSTCETCPNSNNGYLPSNLSLSGPGPTAFNIKETTPNVHVGAYNHTLGTIFNADLSQIRDEIYDVTNWLVEYEPGNLINDSTDGGIHDGAGAIDTPADMNWSLSGSALPVELVHFDAYLENNEVVLEWITVTEHNSKCFSLERSGDKADFKTLVETPASGYSSTMKQYSFVDSQPLEGMNYYRLKQIDLDGSYTYYSVKTVELNSKSGIRLFPNPVVDILSLKGDFVNVKVYNLISQNGKVIKSGVLYGSQHSIDVFDLDPGLYTLKIGKGEEVESFHFIKG